MNHLFQVAREARHIDASRDPVVWQMLAGELPLVLAYRLPEILVCHEAEILAWSTLATGLTELLDRDGLPSAAHMPLLPPLVASWTRARAIALQLGDDVWQEPASQQFELALLNAARLGTGEVDLWNAAAKFELEKPTRRLLRNLAIGDFDQARDPEALPRSHARLAFRGIQAGDS